MDLRINHVRNRGKPNEELVVLFAEAGCDLGYYALCDTTFLPNGRISNALRHFFWFPHHSVEAGDYVMLRTGFGADRTYVDANGKRVHLFHWRLGVCVWNDDGDAAVLISTPQWSSLAA